MFLKFWKHLKTINHHKMLVMKGCFRVGLYKQGLLHDLSKYMPSEFLVGCKYYQGDVSPNNAEREDRGYSSAWLHHKGRNKHHMEYWIDYGMPSEPAMVGMRMPDNYVVEMFIDRMSASKNYQKEKYPDRSALEYYLRGKIGISCIRKCGNCWKNCCICWRMRGRMLPLIIFAEKYCIIRSKKDK